MRGIFLITGFAIIASVVVAQELSDETVLATPKEVESAVKDLILKHYPDAKLTLNERFFAAQANTMEFTVHNVMRDGSIKEIPDKYPGPKHDGFMLSVTSKEGVYGGPLMLPQTLRHPYWETHVGQIVRKDNSSHLFINYKFGSHVKRTEFHRSILRLLRSTTHRALNERNLNLGGESKPKTSPAPQSHGNAE